MIRTALFSAFLLFLTISGSSQSLIRAQELISGSKDFTGAQVRINQDVRVDSMLTRNINANRDYKGIDGFRIQIYRGSTRNAREEANKAKADFISEFPELNSYLRFDQPNFFKVRVGDYRTKHDAYPDYVRIRKKFPNAYIVNDIINFPELEK
ncbi:MAG: SPOR domain-containing protein [Bacteroidales bacterium]